MLLGVLDGALVGCKEGKELGFVDGEGEGPIVGVELGLGTGAVVTGLRVGSPSTIG